MKLLLLSRPIVNAGDFLFIEKAQEAFKKICPEVELVNGHTTMEYTMEYLNLFAAIVVVGGPIYDNQFLTANDFPLLKNVSKVVAPIYFLSNGWYGKDSRVNSVYEYRFSNNVMDILRTIEDRGGAFSCRDKISYIILRNNGIKEAYMIGCTSWYDYKCMEMVVPCYRGEINNIIISDQGITKDNSNWDWKYKALCETINVIKAKFPNANYIFTFNGGINTKYSSEYNCRVCSLLDDRGISYKDISGSSKGFSLCLGADLHIGFRVHTHIYCMSKRIPSILIGEDARGSGLNQTLGTPDILDFSINGNKWQANKYLEKQLGLYIDELVKTEFLLLRSSYVKMNEVFEYNFIPFIKKICMHGKKS